MFMIVFWVLVIFFFILPYKYKVSTILYSLKNYKESIIQLFQSKLSRNFFINGPSQG